MDEVPGMPARKASIVELTAATADQAALVKLLDRLGMRERLPAFEWDRDLNWITASDQKTTFSANELSGGLRYRLRPLEDEPGTDVTTSPARLEQIARTFLDQMGRPIDRLTLERITYLRTEMGSSDGYLLAPATLDAGL